MRTATPLFVTSQLLRISLCFVFPRGNMTEKCVEEQEKCAGNHPPNEESSAQWMRGFDTVYTMLFDSYHSRRTRLLSDFHQLE